MMVDFEAMALAYESRKDSPITLADLLRRTYEAGQSDHARVVAGAIRFSYPEMISRDAVADWIERRGETWEG